MVIRFDALFEKKFGTHMRNRSYATAVEFSSALLVTSAHGVFLKIKHFQHISIPAEGNDLCFTTKILHVQTNMLVQCKTNKLHRSVFYITADITCQISLKLSYFIFYLSKVTS